MSQLSVLTLSTLYPSPQHPGRGIFVRNRLEAVAATAAVDLRVIVPVSSTDRKPAAAKATPAPNSIPVTYAPWNTLPGLGSLAPRLIRHQIGVTVAKAIRDHRPALLDAQFGYPDGPVVAAFARRHYNLPYTITLRGSEVVHAGHYPSRRKALESAFRGAAAVIAVSNRLRDFAVSLGANPANTVCIPNGVDSTVFAPPADRQAQRSIRWSIPDDGRKLLVVAGNLIRGKGFHHVIEAAHVLLQEGIRLELIIAGPGGFEPAYEAELKELPARRNIEPFVRFCGRLDQTDLASLFGAADLFVHASEREGWPNVVHEALACGTPVVATDVGAVPDLIASPQLGRIVPNPAALQDAIRTALQSPWNRTAISASAHSRSWSNVATELIAIWNQVTTRP